MGNKTRKLHNLRSRFQHLAEVPAIPATLEFPFHKVDDLTMTFGSSIPGYREVVANIPAEFKDNYRNPWCQFAGKCFFGGADLTAWKWRNPALKRDQLRYLKTWLGSFDPSHETKEAVCGWLLSLMLLEVPAK